MAISPARVHAFDILLAIERESLFSSGLLASLGPDIDPRDRALCHEIVLGVLRRKLLLERLLDDFSNRKKLDSEVRIACLIGLYQILFLDRIPRHSIVNDSVDLTARAKKTSGKGFVNAFLRRAPHAVPDLKFDDDLERHSVLTSHPRWLLERWVRAFGFERAVAIADANNEPPPLAFRFTANSTHESKDRVAGFRRSQYVGSCLFADRAEPELVELADKGEIYFQDEASQLVGTSIELARDSRYIDLCAAPGGKTAQIAMGWPDSLLIASDISGRRIAQMRESFLRCGVSNVAVVQLDATSELPFEPGSFDTVLLDAPCTGTGTIRHNPEIRYLLDESSIERNANKQRRMLENASKLVKAGGVIHYTTCSIEPDENESVVEAVISDEPGVELVRSNIDRRFTTERGFARTFPDRDSMDGFFVATLKRCQV